MPNLTKRYPIKARDYLKAGEVSIQIQGLLKIIGFAPDFIRRVSLCAYEAEMNVVMHGGDGELTLEVDTDRVDLDVRDAGPGIEDIGLALQEGYSTASEEAREMGFGAGMGLPNIQKNSDSLDIISEKGKGTEVKIGFIA
ncbi:MAG: ATP-binding protein [Deltaproteobacteria bacterium]|nr:ATP-binding protein [Deltaproteobacteria bacterium]